MGKEVVNAFFWCCNGIAMSMMKAVVYADRL